MTSMAADSLDNNCEQVGGAWSNPRVSIANALDSASNRSESPTVGPDPDPDSDTAPQPEAKLRIGPVCGSRFNNSKRVGHGKNRKGWGEGCECGLSAQTWPQC